jgi:hypothetical protein
MARTVDTTMALPRQIIAPGAEIVHQNPASNGGLLYVARSLNTLYDQHRGVLVNDGEWDSESSILGSGSSDNLRYRVRLWGSGSQTETCTVGAYMYGNGGVGSTSIQVSDGTNTATITGSTGSTGTVFTRTNTMTIIDNAEYADLTFTDTGTATGVVVGAFAYYQRNRSTLPASTAQYYTGTTFCPQDDALFADNFPLTSAVAYTLRDNVAEMYGRTGQALSSSWGTVPGGSEVGTMLSVPEGVDTLKLYLDGDYSSGSGGYSVTTELATYTGSFTASRAFTSAISVDVTGLDVVTLSMSGTTNGRLYGASAYWDTRSLP